MFGENRAIIPRRAITTVRLSWQRSRGVLVFGLILFLASLALIIANQMNQPDGIAFEYPTVFCLTIDLVVDSIRLAGCRPSPNCTVLVSQEK